MSLQTFRAIGVGCLLLGSVPIALAADPLIGKWKLDQSKSKMSGEQMKIESLGGNKYKLTYGEVSYSLVADGTDQPTPFGRTRSITQEQPNVWRVEDKRDGNSLGRATWTVSPDGKTMNLHITGTFPDGTPFDEHITRTRVAGSSGFVGTWEDRGVKMGAPIEFEVQPFEADGLTLLYPAMKDSLSMKFDGKDYEETGPYVSPGSTSSGRRVDDHTIEFTDKVKGKVMDTATLTVSADGKTLTYTVQDKGQSKPVVYVYERE